MQGMPYVPGLPVAAPGPLTRFLPPLEQGSVAAWLTRQLPPSSWLIDPFGFSPLLPVEAARAGYRILVTVNNPITRFLLELAADPPSQSDFKAGLAELAASKRGDERLETHLQTLYLTRCQQCGRELQADSFLWQKGADAPSSRTYQCPECGDHGEREATVEDVQRARQIAETDGLHRSRALERVVKKGDPDRAHVQEAIQHYLPRPLYFLATILNRIEGLDLAPARRRALTASVLVACDAGNTLWGHPQPTLRPKQLTTPEQFREQNLWTVLENAFTVWAGQPEPVAAVAWPGSLDAPAGICVYEGRLKGLVAELDGQIPISAAIASVPRPNQAFWTLSALWAGWLWGQAAVEPYRMALRRRRYDFGWNATALQSAFGHLSGLLSLGAPFLGFVPDVEPQFLLSSMSAISASGFELKGLALRTGDDPVQFLWERGERLRLAPQTPGLEDLRHAMQDFLGERGEPVSYIHLKAAALQVLARLHALPPVGEDVDAGLREARLEIETALQADSRFVQHTTGDSVEAGTWGLRQWPSTDSLADRVEAVVVTHLQQHPQTTLLETEAEVFPRLPGLFTPSLRVIQAVLASYAHAEGDSWILREEDRASSRQADLRSVGDLVQRLGSQLSYKTRREQEWILWEEKGSVAIAIAVTASAIVLPIIAQHPAPSARSLLVLPGSRIALLDYKTLSNPDLAARLADFKIIRFRSWRSMAEAKILTRETFEEQLASDPVERAPGQMMMF